MNDSSQLNTQNSPIFILLQRINLLSSIHNFKSQTTKNLNNEEEKQTPARRSTANSNNGAR